MKHYEYLKDIQYQQRLTELEGQYKIEIAALKGSVNGLQSKNRDLEERLRLIRDEHQKLKDELARLK